MPLRYRCAAHQVGSGGRKEPCNLLLLDKGGQADDEFAKTLGGRDAFESRETVNRHPIWLELFDYFFDLNQMIFQSGCLWIDAYHLQFPILLHLVEIHSPSV